jgi:hypothetical protein
MRPVATPTHRQSGNAQTGPAFRSADRRSHRPAGEHHRGQAVP